MAHIVNPANPLVAATPDVAGIENPPPIAPNPHLPVAPARMVTNNQGEVEFEMDRYHAPALMVFMGKDRGRTILKEHAKKGMEWTNHTLFINRIREPHWMSSDWYKIAVMRLIWSGTVVCKKDGRSMVYKLHDVETSNDEKIWNPFTRNYAR